MATWAPWAADSARLGRGLGLWHLAMRYSLFAICMLSVETPGRQQDSPIDILSRSCGSGSGSLGSPTPGSRNVNALHSYRSKAAQLAASYWSSWHPI